MDTNRKRREIAFFKERVISLQQDVDRDVRNCTHAWGPEEDDHEYKEAYTIPGDPPGTCGVDRRFPVHVGAETKYRWKRTCEKCGHVEYTTKRKTSQTEADFG